MPKPVDDCVQSILDENPEMSESRAYAICNAQQNRGELAVADDATHDELLEAAAIEGPCPDGQVDIGEECVPLERVEAPPSILSTPQHLTLKSLDTEPIERVEEGDSLVRYKSLKLLSPGIWADAGSQTETYYPPDGIANLDPDWDDSEHDGPPVNIMHDLDVEEWEAHEPSVAGHVDPETIDTDDDGNLYGDVVFDTEKGAGQFADENLQSTLENQGTVGFGGPSVEIPARGLEQSQDPVRDMPRVDGGLLTGVALVMDPASKSVNFAREAARRPVAMSGVESNQEAKVLTHESERMSDDLPEAIRLLSDVDTDALNRALQAMGDVVDMVEQAESEGFDSSEQTVSDLIDFVREEMDPDDGGLQELQDAADAFLETVEAESLDATSAEAFRDWASEAGGEMEDKDEEEDEEGDDDTQMQDGEELEAIREQVTNLSSRLEDLEDQVAQAMTADDVNSELEEAAGNKLADADSVDELSRRLEELEEQGKEAKTLTDARADEDEIDYSTADSGIDYDPATGSMSGR